MATTITLTPQSVKELLDYLICKKVPKDTPIHLILIEPRGGRTHTIDRFFMGGSYDILADNPTVDLRVVEKE